MGPYQRLREWFASLGKTQEEVGKLLGCTGVAVGLYLNERRRPELKAAFAIQHATESWEKGPILASEWLSVEKAEPSPPPAETHEESGSEAA